MSKETTVFPGMSTPWGQADYVTQLFPGVGIVGTPRHGGVKVCAELNKRIPEALRAEGGWYEEDCAYSIPFVVLEAEILQGGEEYAKRTIRSGKHIRSLKRWYTEAARVALTL